MIKVLMKVGIEGMFLNLINLKTTLYYLENNWNHSD
jgi:hypothetical protein